MEKTITNTQYLKKGSITNVGRVVEIHNNQSFKTDDGFSHHLKEEKIIRKKL